MFNYQNLTIMLQDPIIFPSTFHMLKLLPNNGEIYTNMPQSLVCRWFRVRFHIHIEIRPIIYPNKICWTYGITFLDNPLKILGVNEQFDSYEIATEQAISHAAKELLTNE